MNYLAHALLSTDDAEVLTGNIIADIAKGAVRKQLQPKYLTGIEMHRYIDQFTDQYPALKAIKKKLQPWTGRYTPVLLDIYMDFFIGAKWDEYSDQGKQEFETMIYNKLNSQVYDLPSEIGQRLHNMIIHEWLHIYWSTLNLEKVISRLSVRVKSPELLINTTQGFELVYPFLENDFPMFYYSL